MLKDKKELMAEVWISQENICDGVSFDKVPHLQCSACNFAIKIIHYRYFSKNVLNTSCLKKRNFEKKNPMMDYLPNKVATL